jgi:hypothetical protein
MCVAPFKNLFLDFPRVAKLAGWGKEQEQESRRLELPYGVHQGVDC